MNENIIVTVRGLKHLPPSNISNKKSCKSKRVRTIFTPEQLERLEAEFERQQYMVGPERLYLAHTLQLTEAQVRVFTATKNAVLEGVYLQVRYMEHPPELSCPPLTNHVQCLSLSISDLLSLDYKQLFSTIRMWTKQSCHRTKHRNVSFCRWRCGSRTVVSSGGNTTWSWPTKGWRWWSSSSSWSTTPIRTSKTRIAPAPTREWLRGQITTVRTEQDCFTVMLCVPVVVECKY